MSLSIRTALLAPALVLAGLALAFAQDKPGGTDDDGPVRLKRKPKAGDTPAKVEEKKDDKKAEDKADPGEPAVPPDSEKEVLDRIGRNLRKVDERLANKEVDAATRQTQDDVVKDIDALIRAAENPPPPSGQNPDQDPNQQPNDQDPPGAQNKQQTPQAKSGSKSQGRPQREMARQNREGKSLAKNQPATGQPKSEQPKPSDTGGTGNDKIGALKDRNADLYKSVWGHLPETLRAEMDAYANDKEFMAKYDDLIKKYYRAVAAQGTRTPGRD